MKTFYVALVILLPFCISIPLFAQTEETTQLLQSLELSKDDTTRINTLILISLSYNQTQPDSSEFYALLATELAEKKADVFFQVKALIHLGRVYIRQGSYTSGLEAFQKALAYLDNLPNQISLRAQVLRGIGNIFFIQYKYDEALSFFDEALDYFRQTGDSSGVTLVYGGFANVYFETDRKELALTYYKKQIRIYEEADEEMNLGSAYLNIGMLYDTMDSLSQAIDYSQRALEIAEKNNALVMMTYPLKVLSSVSNALENFPQAIDYGQKSLDIAEELGIIYEQKDAHLNLSYSYERLGQYKEAYSHFKAHKELNDSLLNEDANARLAEMRAKYESEKQEREIAVLETENELQRTRTAAISSSLGLVLAIFIIGIIWFAAKKRKEFALLEKDRLLAESEENLIKEELANSKLREENLQKELTNYALHIVEKNDFLESLKSEMVEIRSEIKNDEVLKHINSLGSKIYRNLMLNKDREEFELQVDHACEGFFRNLEKKYPELTSQEKRLAALLRLNLSSKEISGIMNISPKSVDQGRYRLRKKLPLKKNRSLSTFLNQI